MYRLAIFLLFFSFQANCQIREFDQLEMLYSQEHYKMVLRKSNRLLDNPEYDFSELPKFYRSLSLFQLAQNERWYQRNSTAMDQAAEIFEKIKASSDGKKVFNAHINEVSALKADLYQWGEDLERMGKNDVSMKLQKILVSLFDRVPDIDEKKNNTTIPQIVKATGQRADVIAFAQKYIGTPYLWAGVTPKGFDCSGYATFVMKQFGVNLPRRAADQFDISNKIKQKNVLPGDLIFFSNGGGVSHVGIVISNTDEPLSMIHSSSSQGIVITSVEGSDYWKKRIAGFGRFL